MKFRNISTQDGVKEVPLKSYDGREVPIGYFYESDMHSIWLEVKSLLDKSVNPIIQRLFDIEISKYFYIDDYTFKATLYAGHYKRQVEADSIYEALTQISSSYDPDDILNDDFFINVEFETNRRKYEVKKYGCQIKVDVGFETWADEELEKAHSVWFLYIGDEKTVIETPFTSDQEDKIIGYYLGYLWKSEEQVSPISQ